MGKYVLLQFDDDEEAKAFINEVRKAQDPETRAFCRDDWADFNVRAVWHKPDSWCQCGTRSGWGKTKKLGLWVCADCKLPSRAWFRGDAWHNIMGANLLPISEGAPEYRGIMHQKWPGYNPDDPKGHLR
jgi:hypothetical protein